MAHSLVVAESRLIPVAAAEAFDGTLPAAPPDIFKHWYGPLPPVKEVREQAGVWGVIGQARVLRLAGGASMREELTRIDPPRSFSYRLTEISGPMTLLVDHVLGEWKFTSAARGTEVTWRWDIYPKSALSSWALPLFGKMWKGYARQSLAELTTILTA